MAREIEHSEHAPGTREDCEECRALAYEPGWYRALRDERVIAKDPALVAIPEPDEADADVQVRETPTAADRDADR
jgi:hypothetical protein